MELILLLVLAVVALVLVRWLFFSFAAQRPKDYADTAPAFDLRTALDGPLVSHGVIYGPTGRVGTRFVAQMRGKWDDAGGRLVEDFRYSSGRTQQREWKIVPQADGRFAATADDVIGQGDGQVSGATALMRYRIRLPAEAGGWQMDVTDWLYLGEDGVIVNRSEFRRFGIRLGELVGTIRRAGQ